MSVNSFLLERYIRGSALLWLVSLVSALLLVADVMARASKVKRCNISFIVPTLAALVPQYGATIPADPFRGEPLKLAAVAGGLTLYSVGPDLIDDAGSKEYDLEEESKEIKPGDSTVVPGSTFVDRRLKPSRG